MHAIVNMPITDKQRILADIQCLIQNNYAHKKSADNKKIKLKELLLSGPTMSDEQYANYLENQKAWKRWTAKIYS